MKHAVAVLMALAALAAPLRAHHSFAAYYFEEQSVSIEGTVTEFAYTAPHAWVYVLVRDADGRTQRYAAEWANPRRLANDGVTRETLKAGDVVVITGSPGRTASEFKLHLKQIERPADGWRWALRKR